MEMNIKTKKGEKMFLLIVEGGLDWCVSEDALVLSFNTLEEAESNGFSDVEFERFTMLEKGEVYSDFDYEGIHVMRIN